MKCLNEREGAAKEGRRGEGLGKYRNIDGDDQRWRCGRCCAGCVDFGAGGGGMKGN